MAAIEGAAARTSIDCLTGNAVLSSLRRVIKRLPMKAAHFEYSRPRSVAEACALLAREEDARPIAGGQTLVPMMAMRLARPTRLVDIGRIPELAYVRADGESIAIGATTRQAIVEHDVLVAKALPLLARAMPWVGHAATRNRGTVGGSIANADPAAEIALVLATMDGDVTATSDKKTAAIAATDFFQGPMATSLAGDALLTAVRFPIWRQGRIGAALLEISARQGDFAYVSAAVQVALDADGCCLACAIGVGGGTPVPTRLATACAALAGAPLTENRVRDALMVDVERLEIMSDPHASVPYRRRVAATLARRALIAARDEAMALEARA